MSAPDPVPDAELNRLIREASACSDFLRAWEAEAGAIDALMAAEWSEPARPAEPPAPRPRTVPDGWFHAVAVSAGASNAEDWWVLRRAADGAELYVGTPGRVRSEGTSGAVVVRFPDRRATGTVLYTSPDVAVIRLAPPGREERP